MKFKVICPELSGLPDNMDFPNGDNQPYIEFKKLILALAESNVIKSVLLDGIAQGLQFTVVDGGQSLDIPEFWDATKLSNAISFFMIGDGELIIETAEGVNIDVAGIENSLKQILVEWTYIGVPIVSFINGE